MRWLTAISERSLTPSTRNRERVFMRHGFRPRLEQLECRITPSSGPYYPDETGGNSVPPPPSTTGDSTIKADVYSALQGATSITVNPYVY
jgi:hypothetical protein